eukprot:Hpha_TRINITY_DN6875_c0_g1::TRINITY_DN6875_c0_g1_i1::g.46200::m.46200
MASTCQSSPPSLSWVHASRGASAPTVGNTPRGKSGADVDEVAFACSLNRACASRPLPPSIRPQQHPATSSGEAPGRGRFCETHRVISCNTSSTTPGEALHLSAAITLAASAAQTGNGPKLTLHCSTRTVSSIASSRSLMPLRGPCPFSSARACRRRRRDRCAGSFSSQSSSEALSSTRASRASHSPQAYNNSAHPSTAIPCPLRCGASICARAVLTVRARAAASRRGAPSTPRCAAACIHTATDVPHAASSCSLSPAIAAARRTASVVPCISSNRDASNSRKRRSAPLTPGPSSTDTSSALAAARRSSVLRERSDTTPRKRAPFHKVPLSALTSSHNSASSHNVGTWGGASPARIAIVRMYALAHRSVKCSGTSRMTRRFRASTRRTKEAKRSVPVSPYNSPSESPSGVARFAIPVCVRSLPHPRASPLARSDPTLFVYQ